MDTDLSQLDPEQMRRNLAITLGAQQPQLAALRAPAGPEMAAPGPITLPGQDRVPNLAINAPAVKAPRGTVQGDQAERARMLGSGAGVDQIYGKVTGSDFGQDHPIAGKVLGGLAQGIGKLGDIGLSAVAPALAINLPGTEFHHAAQLHGLNKQIGAEEGEAKNEAQTAELQAQPELAAAKNELGQEKHAETVRQHDQQLREHGFKTDEQGNIIPLSYEEMSESQQAVHDLKASQEELTDASAALKKAQAAGIPAQVQMAQQRIATAQKNAETASQRLGLTSQALQFREQQATDKQDQPPAAVQGRAYQGTAIMEAGNSLKDEIDKHKDKIGNLGSYWAQYINGTPIADPEISGLMARISSYAALQPALHGFRGQQALAEFQKIIGGVPKNAEALKAAIDAIDDTAAIVQRTGSRHSSGQGAPKEGETKTNSAGDKVKFTGGKWVPE